MLCRFLWCCVQDKDLLFLVFNVFLVERGREAALQVYVLLLGRSGAGIELSLYFFFNCLQLKIILMPKWDILLSLTRKPQDIQGLMRSGLVFQTPEPCVPGCMCPKALCLLVTPQALRPCLWEQDGRQPQDCPTLCKDPQRVGAAETAVPKLEEVASLCITAIEHLLIAFILFHCIYGPD